MIFVKLASGNSGVGVVGHNLVAALGRLTAVEHLAFDTIVDEPLPGPLLERFYRPVPSFAAARNLAYIVFENDCEFEESHLRLRCKFDLLAATSRWCEHALRVAGLSSVTTIHHGVDHAIFNPQRASRQNRTDRFVVFSAGKFELRKAQDVVVRAFQRFSERHDDALLVAAWQNAWSQHAETMRGSPHVAFAPRAREPAEDAIRRWLATAGVDLDKVVLIPPLPNAALAAVYRDSDVGVFPSRCEGATNLSMMEYMACGRPVIATDFSGHRDILTAANSLPLRASRPLLIKREAKTVARWCEPNVDEIVAALERAYDDRELMASVAGQAAADLATWTWERAANRFLQVMQGVTC